MSSISPGLVIVIALLIALVFGTTIWMFARRRGIDHRGAVKGTPSQPDKVKRENTPDRR
jgi:hypothetical protein